MITIFNPRGWPDSERLAQALRDLGVEAQASRAPVGDFVVGWGFSSPTSKLNAKILGNKLSELQRFREAGVPTVNFSLTPLAEGTWLGRRKKHLHGSDLVRTLRHPDFYVQKATFAAEFRVHVFKEKVIRTGIKKPKGEGHHPWVRSLHHGWMIDYGKPCQDAITDAVRDASRKAVKALEYDFGAVDVALNSEGTPIVLEVNAAPGLSGNTTLAYARHVKKAYLG